MKVGVLHPTVGTHAQPRLMTNAASCVLRVGLGKHRLLLLGDLTAREEDELAGREADPKVNRVSVPHHGSRNSLSEILLDAAAPAWASAQAGYRNRFSDPDPEVVRRYLARAVHVVRSDESGMAQWRFRADGAVDLHRWRASAHRYWNDRPGPGASEPDADAGGATRSDAGNLLAEPVGPF